MQTCYNCGKEVDDQVLICPDCGALVRRYGKPAQSQEQTPSEEQYLSDVQQPQVNAPRGIVWRDARGKLRLRGLFCAWLVVCAVIALYSALSFGCGLYLFGRQDEVRNLFAPYPEFSQMLELLELMMELIGQFYALYVLLLLVYLVKGVAYIWFMVKKKKLALYFICGASAALYLLMVLSGSGFSALLYVADCALTMLFLCTSWKQLPE